MAFRKVIGSGLSYNRMASAMTTPVAPNVHMLRPRRGFEHQWTIGNSGTNYGYDSPAGGGYGNLFPNFHQGVEIVQFIATTADVVVLATEANVPLYGNSSILVYVSGAPSPSYQVDPIGPGLGFYQTSIPELAGYVVSKNGARLGLNITAAP